MNTNTQLEIEMNSFNPKHWNTDVRLKQKEAMAALFCFMLVVSGVLTVANFL